MASSLIKNINNLIVEDVSSSFSYSQIFAQATLRAVKIGKKLLYVSFFGHTRSGDYIPNSEEHLLTSATYNSTILAASCHIIGEADNGAVADTDIATVVAFPDSTGVTVSCNISNKTYIRFSGLFYFRD